MALDIGRGPRISKSAPARRTGRQKPSTSSSDRVVDVPYVAAERNVVEIQSDEISIKTVGPASWTVHISRGRSSDTAPAPPPGPARARERSHVTYIAIVAATIAVLLGVAVLNPKAVETASIFVEKLARLVPGATAAVR